MSNTETKVININQVFPNSWNPNVMKKDIFDYLKKSLSEEEGNYLCPILVREISSSRYEIIDWEQRWRAMSDEWFSEILANVVVADDQQARLQTIWMNKFRSSVDEIKLAELLESLREDYWMTDEAIMKEVWLGDVEIDELWALTSLEELSDFVSEDGIEVKDDSSLLKLDFSDEELQYIHDYASILWIDVKTLIMTAVEKSLKHLSSAKEETIEVKWVVQDFDITDLDF